MIKLNFFKFESEQPLKFLFYFFKNAGQICVWRFSRNWWKFPSRSILFKIRKSFLKGAWNWRETLHFECNLGRKSSKSQKVASETRNWNQRSQRFMSINEAQSADHPIPHTDLSSLLARFLLNLIFVWWVTGVQARNWLLLVGSAAHRRFKVPEQ